MAETFIVTMKVRGTVGDKRTTATRRVTVWAMDHGDAVMAAKKRIADATTYEVKKKYGTD